MPSTERSDVQERPPALSFSFLALLGLQQFAEVGSTGRPKRCMMCSAGGCLLFLQGEGWEVELDRRVLSPFFGSFGGFQPCPEKGKRVSFGAIAPV